MCFRSHKRCELHLCNRALENLNELHDIITESLLLTSRDKNMVHYVEALPPLLGSAHTMRAA